MEKGGGAEREKKTEAEKREKGLGNCHTLFLFKIQMVT
jgi:hypothetical protein